MSDVKIVTDFNTAQQVLKSGCPMDKSLQEDFIDGLGDAGLLSTEGGRWQNLRKALQPLFRNGTIDPVLYPIVRDLADEWVQELKEKSGQFMSVGMLAYRFPADVIRNVIADSLPRDVMEALCLDGNESIFFNFLDNYEGKGEDLLYQIQRLQGEDGKLLSSEDLRDHVRTFFSAGFETTEIFILHAVRQIYKHPQVLKKIRKEIQGVDWNHIEAKDVRIKFSYLNNTLREVLRLHPPIREIWRQSASGDERIIIDVKAVQRDPNVFSEPKVFDPERWLEGGRTADLRAWMPFGKGGRVCIGQGIAMMEVLVLTAKLVQNFDFKLSEDFRILDAPKAKNGDRPVDHILNKPVGGFGGVFTPVEPAQG